MPEVVVGIPTFRRPRSLERLLTALERLETDARVSVVVADNDAENHEGYDLCQALQAHGFRWPLEAVIVEQRGIAQVRNALVGRALTDPQAQFMAMLDDDEWPSPQWLECFLRVQEQTGADALQGTIVFEFATAPKTWARGFDGIPQSSVQRDRLPCSKEREISC